MGLVTVFEPVKTISLSSRLPSQLSLAIPAWIGAMSTGDATRPFCLGLRVFSFCECSVLIIFFDYFSGPGTAIGRGVFVSMSE